MKRSIQILILSLFSLLLYAEENPQSLFEKGNTAYKNQEYQKAIEHYKAILDQGFKSPELFFNLGNAHYQLNEVGPSVLYYEKAMKSAPDNEDFKFNLKMARLRVTDESAETPNLFFLSGFKNLLIDFASDRWAKLSLLFLWITFVFFAGFIWVKSATAKKALFFSGIFSILLTLLFLTFSIQQYNYEKKKQSAIVMVTNTYVKSRPEQESTDLFILREGVKVKVLEKEEDWVRVKFSEEKIGWIERSKLGMI